MDAEENRSSEQGDHDRETSAQGSDWSEEAIKWHAELKAQEDKLAPWLSVEWTGEQMKVNRG
jgi:hypothetical protein